MTEQWQPSTEPLILHVIPTPVARGAQREARALADRLDAPGTRAHRVLALFDGRPEVSPNLSLRASAGGVASALAPRVVVRLRRALDRLEPAVVVAHGGEPLKYLVPALVGRATPLVYYAIGTFAGSRGRRAQVFLWRRLAARADAVAAEGYEVAVECHDLLHVPSERITMTPNGRDPSVFRPDDTHGRADGHDRRQGPPVLAFVGALTEGKRPDRFIEMVAALRARGVECTAWVAGDGPMRRALVAPAAAAGVELLGSRSDIPALLRGADALVFPSRPTGEGMPGVLIEAGLSALPVVATDAPGVRTVVDDGVTGLVVSSAGLAALVDATGRLLADAAGRRTMGEAARTRCVERFGIDAVARLWLGILEPLLP